VIIKTIKPFRRIINLSKSSKTNWQLKVIMPNLHFQTKMKIIIKQGEKENRRGQKGKNYEPKASTYLIFCYWLSSNLLPLFTYQQILLQSLFQHHPESKFLRKVELAKIWRSQKTLVSNTATERLSHVHIKFHFHYSVIDFIIWNSWKM